uniref:Nicotinamide phosphoribosyltransferase n=1 Tax=Pyramimonas obovata TaxID=1411642 RepID=A0A7S0MWA0_9CHLO
MGSEALFSGIPIAVLTDSYKAGHFKMYPAADKMVAYGEFRKGFQLGDGKHDEEDKRLIFFGIRYIVETFLNKRWTVQDVENADKFYSQHLAPFYTEYPWPKDLFLKFIKENDGYFPVKLEALPEGSVIHSRVPVYQITAEKEYSHLCTFMETLLTMVWYPTCVATLSRRCKDVISKGFEKTVDDDVSFLLNSRLHDFGFRGCTSTEQSVLGGCAHLLNFDGTDTMSAAYYAQFVLNNGKPVGQSIPATEHSVMTSWRTEVEAVKNMISHFGDGLFACVMDSYEYSEALRTVLPEAKRILDEEKKVNGTMVIRPDSGDPVEAVLEGLHKAEAAFGAAVNKKGFKVLKGAAVIQGDGIDIQKVAEIVEAVMAAGFSVQNVAFGMGGGLLQKVNRDTMSFATKLSHIHYKGEPKGRDIMKAPKSDTGKFSLPGILQVRREKGVCMVYSVPDHAAGAPLVEAAENELRVVYDCGPLKQSPWDDFDTVRARVEAEWRQLAPLKNVSPLSSQLKERIAEMSPEHAKGAASKA